MRAETRVRDRMRTEVRTVDPNDNVLDARRVQEAERIRHLPVVDEEGELVGVLSQRDMFHRGLIRALGFGATAQERIAATLPVKEIMVSDVVTIGPDASLAEAARLLLEHKIGCLPVTEKGALVGILSEADLLAIVAGADQRQETK